MSNTFFNKAIIIVVLFFICCSGCSTEERLKVRFLDEYIIPDSLAFQNQVIGGLSGINYTNDKYYFVIDDAKNPRLLKANLNIHDRKIKDVEFLDVLTVAKKGNSFLEGNALDLEDLFYDKQAGLYYLVSEGAINYDISPSIFTVDAKGNYVNHFPLPKSLQLTTNYKHNGAFEGLTESFNKQGFWIATEAPMQSDGEEPSLSEGISPIRITYFDKTQKLATKQFAYHLDYIKKPSKGDTNLNGVTAILEYQKNEFFVLERAYQSGYGPFGNTINLYLAKATPATTNILDVPSLKEIEYVPLTKELLFSFDTIKSQLSNGFIDNLEGMTFGPTLSNGRGSLLIVSDDNFQLYGKQLNQLILLEIEKIKG